MSPFDISNGLSSSKADHWEDISEGDYVPFMINKAFSYHLDTLDAACEMNENSDIPKLWQYDYYRAAINPKKKRFSKWAKPEKDALVLLVSDAYQVNRQKAITISNLLNTSAIDELKSKTNRGGR